jgi:hypothetical protein
VPWLKKVTRIKITECLQLAVIFFAGLLLMDIEGCQVRKENLARVFGKG